MAPLLHFLVLVLATANIAFDLVLDKRKAECLQNGLLGLLQSERLDLHESFLIADTNSTENKAFCQGFGSSSTRRAFCQTVEALKQIESHEGEELHKDQAFDSRDFPKE
jgi:hypothetical protein